ncbi:putative B3 domain-containing protein Os03g0621600 isoform X1 [Medicago truncatula]|uniref:putative B3 domain-containing protein Os03g0621600 isoform X1 n=1 Tax=Medicago truncatula TaxID=3880 RepID=UPI001967758B|nr:putative B3 domain-containing protein Os03g0621600 isoform X1 [Medicago truncatula]
MSLHHPKEFLKIVQHHELHNGELRVPKKFVEKYWKRIPNPVILRLPNGAQKEIFWVERDGDIWFKRNWENFAKSLKHGYALVFKYLGGPYFKVKIFGHNTLEKDYSNIKFIDESCEGREEVVQEVQRRKNGKRKISQQKITGSNKGGIIKKAKKCSTISEKENNENPSFELEMSQTYAHGYTLRIPSDFSRTYLNENLKGSSGSIRFGENMPMKVKVRFQDIKNNRTCIVTSGWKPFAKKYNLQVGDKCKFVMTQLQPLSFTITITQAKGYEGMISCDDDIGKRIGIEGSSRSCHVLPTDLEGSNVMKPITIEIRVNSTYPYIGHEFFKRHKECHGEFVELTNGGKSWLVKVKYYQSTGFRFYAGWQKFKQDCKLKIGDTCKLKLIDEKMSVFQVSIERMHHH